MFRILAVAQFFSHLNFKAPFEAEAEPAFTPSKIEGENIKRNFRFWSVWMDLNVCVSVPRVFDGRITPVSMSTVWSRILVQICRHPYLAVLSTSPFLVPFEMQTCVAVTLKISEVPLTKIVTLAVRVIIDFIKLKLHKDVCETYSGLKMSIN